MDLVILLTYLLTYLLHGAETLLRSSYPHIPLPENILVLPSHLRLGLPNGLFPSGRTE
jgi:hypothetical protein